MLPRMRPCLAVAVVQQPPTPETRPRCDNAPRARQRVARASSRHSRSQLLKEILHDRQLCALGSIAVVDDDKAIVVFRDIPVRDAVQGEKRALLGDREGIARRQRRARQLVGVVGIEDSPPVTRPPGIHSATGGDLEQCLARVRIRTDVDLVAPAVVRREEQPVAIGREPRNLFREPARQHRR